MMMMLQGSISIIAKFALISIIIFNNSVSILLLVDGQLIHSNDNDNINNVNKISLIDTSSSDNNNNNNNFYISDNKHHRNSRHNQQRLVDDGTTEDEIIDTDAISSSSSHRADDSEAAMITINNNNNQNANLNNTNKGMHQLMKFIFENYDKELMPTLPVLVRLDVLLLKVKTTVEREGIFESVIALFIEWFDYRMVWDPAEYGNVTVLAFDSEKVWLPDIAMTNSADHLYSISRDTRFVVRVTNDGLFKFVPTGTARTWCDLRLLTFPFDIQTCSLEFESWSLDANTMQFREPANIIVDSNFLSTQWTLCYKNSTVYSAYYGFTGETFSRVKFDFTVRRKSTFYLINLVFPCATLSTIQLMVFAIPSIDSSSDRIGFGTTNLLTLVVFQTIVTAEMPKTSDAVTALSKYIIALIILSAIGILESVCVERMRRISCKAPPPYAVKIARYIPILWRRKSSQASSPAVAFANIVDYYCPDNNNYNNNNNNNDDNISESLATATNHSNVSFPTSPHKCSSSSSSSSSSPASHHQERCSTEHHGSEKYHVNGHSMIIRSTNNNNNNNSQSSGENSQPVNHPIASIAVEASEPNLCNNNCENRKTTSNRWVHFNNNNNNSYSLPTVINNDDATTTNNNNNYSQGEEAAAEATTLEEGDDDGDNSPSEEDGVVISTMFKRTPSAIQSHMAMRRFVAACGQSASTSPKVVTSTDANSCHYYNSNVIPNSKETSNKMIPSAPVDDMIFIEDSPTCDSSTSHQLPMSPPPPPPAPKQPRPPAFIGLQRQQNRQQNHHVSTNAADLQHSSITASAAAAAEASSSLPSILMPQQQQRQQLLQPTTSPAVRRKVSRFTAAKEHRARREFVEQQYAEQWGEIATRVDIFVFCVSAISALAVPFSLFLPLLHFGDGEDCLPTPSL